MNSIILAESAHMAYGIERKETTMRSLKEVRTLVYDIFAVIGIVYITTKTLHLYHLHQEGDTLMQQIKTLMIRNTRAYEKITDDLRTIRFKQDLLMEELEKLQKEEDPIGQFLDSHDGHHTAEKSTF